MDLPGYLRAQGGAVQIFVKVQPRSSRNEVGPIVANELKIKVTAPPVDAAANQALLEFLAERLDCGRSALQIVRGRTSRHKTILVQGLGIPELVSRLTPG
jgi:uncharacterized protein (TIGR00251 family)